MSLNFLASTGKIYLQGKVYSKNRKVELYVDLAGKIYSEEIPLS